VDEREDDGLEELNATGRLTLAEIAQAALDAELEENDFDWQPVWKMREPAPEPTEPAPPQPSEPSEPAPEPEQPERTPPAPQSAPMEPVYFPLQPELAALWIRAVSDGADMLMRLVQLRRERWRSSQHIEPSRLPPSRAHFDDALLRHQFFDLLCGIGHPLR
jgi:hypothetical protein